MSLAETPPFDLTRLFRHNGLPVIHQTEAAECGLACLAMIACFHGHHVSLGELRRRFSTSLKGATLRNLMETADTLGLASRPLRLELDEIGQLKCPAILHWDLKHFVVLRKVRGGRAWIHDPARGECVLALEDVGRSFTGVALELTFTPAFEPKASAERLKLSALIRRGAGLAPMIVQLAALAAILQLFSLLSPMLSQLVVDQAIARGDADLLTIIALGMAMLLLITALVELLRGYVSLYLGTQLSFQLHTNLLRQALRLPVSWFERRHIGDLMSRFGSIAPVQAIFTTILPSATLNLMMLVVSLAMMLVYAKWLAVIEVCAFLALFGARYGLFPIYRQKMDEGLHLSAKVQSVFLETLRGARAFKMFNRERQRVATWQNEQARSSNNAVALAKFGLWGGMITDGLIGLQKLLVWFLGAKLVIRGDMSLGMLIAFQAYAAQFGAAAGDLSSHLFTLKTLKLHLERLSDIVLSPPERDTPQALGEDSALQGAISLRNVSFRYAEHEPWVLRNVDLDIQPGQFVCFVGPSGQGKSTLLKLLLGLEEPQEGDLLIDGRPLRQVGLRHFREHSAAVLQDDALFSGSIAENICFFDTDFDMDRIQAAARLAQVHGEIASLPMGYLSLIGDMGSTLSGGQRQRVLLARALYRDPAVLFLDEGTAHLDVDSEARVMAVLRELGKTRVVVAHRQAAIAGADRIFQVQNGAVVEIAQASHAAGLIAP